MVRRSKAESPRFEEREENSPATNRRRRRARPLNVAATGIAEPSENPRPGANLGRKEARADHLISDLEKEVVRSPTSAESHRGQVEYSGKMEPNDKIVGPDIGTRPHRPKHRPH